MKPSSLRSAAKVRVSAQCNIQVMLSDHNHKSHRIDGASCESQREVRQVVMLAAQVSSTREILTHVESSLQVAGRYGQLLSKSAKYNATPCSAAIICRYVTFILI